MAKPTTIIEAMPPPPGEQANFTNPSNQSRNTIALHTVCLTLVILCVVMRIYTRSFISRQLGLDDCKILSLESAHSLMLMLLRLLCFRLCKLTDYADMH